MATNIMEEISRTTDRKEKLSKYKNLRKTVKFQITNVNKQVSSGNTITVNEASTRLDIVNGLAGKYETIQDHIDLLTEEVEMDNELTYREEMENNVLKAKVNLQDIISANRPTMNTNQVNFSSQVHQPNQNFTTSNLNFSPYDDRENFSNFTKRLDVFMTLKGITDEKFKTLTFLHALSPLIHQKLYDLCAPEDPKSKSYEQLVIILKQYLDPQASILALQHSFVSREQMVGESVTDFSTELKRMSVNCDFHCSCGKSVCDIFLRLQFIRGLNDPEIRTRLLQEREVKPFNDIINTATAVELSKKESEIISKPYIGHVNQFKQNTPVQSLQKTFYNDRKSNKPAQSVFESLKGKCYRCGDESHRANKCKFIHEICYTCNKTGHIARVCLSKNKTRKVVHYTEKEIMEDDTLHEIHLVTDSRANDKFNVNVDVEGNPIAFELDTGASLSSISWEMFKKTFPNKRVFKTGVEMRTYTGEIIKPRGVSFVNCSYKDQTFIGKLYIINHRVDPIFGREWMREVKLDWANMRSFEETNGSRISSLLQEFEEIFRPGIGVIPNYEAKLQLKDGTQPIYVKPRQVPYAIKGEVDKELQRLESEKIISKLENSEWGTPIVPVVKPNGSIRLCADYKVTLNKVIKDVNYPIPRIDDIFSTMNGGRYFCTLDISNAYLHMMMDEDSAKMQTLSTHKGLFKVNRLMFGVKVAPSLWQRFMDIVLQGTEGVQCFFDDIIVQGTTFDETFKRLRNVLQLLQSKNLRLNRDKCKFFERSINYLGHVIDQNGLHKSPEKVEAIRNTKRPENVNELRSFLGLVTYYNKFVANLSNLIHPLNKLLHKGEKFIWTAECENSFKKTIQEITSEKTLVHFDSSLPLILATDASPVGLGAVISHRMKDGTERPISFASRTLTESERRYSQIDKEATAIYWGLKKFFPYCYGRKFILVTDNKPLVSIFDPHRTLPTMAATRIFNYAHFLSGFDYTIEFRRTEHHSNADFLSRFPHLKAQENFLDDTCIYQLQQLETMPVTKDEITNESLNDEFVKKVTHILKEGKSLEQIGLHDYEYTLQDDCLFKGSRIVIPNNLQGRVLKELHTGHLGIVKMKALARSYCYWKTINNDIENMVKTCKQCCLKQNKPMPTILHPWERPDKPWQRIHVDFAGPCLGNNYYFVVVDAYTKWVEVFPTKTTTSEWCIRTLRHLFSTFGLPFVLVSDNGPQFTSHIFKSYLQYNGITHKTCAPYNPASNGQAERYIQTVKNSLLAMHRDHGQMDIKLQLFLMQLRKVQNSTGQSSYTLMFGRNIRTRLDLMISTSSTEKDSHDGQPHIMKVRSFDIGDRVQALNYNKRGDKWNFGKIVQKQGNVIYVLRMDNGTLWRRHVNQILPCKFGGEC